MLDEVDKKKCSKIKWTQWIASAGVTLLMMQTGLLETWSSPYVVFLTSPNSTIPITLEQASWVVSLTTLGKAIGAFIGVILMKHLGSKTMIIVASIAVMFSWFLLIPVKDVNWILISRFLGGLSVGITVDCFAIYLGEIADPSIRGALVAIAVMGVPLGNLTMSIMGAFLSISVSSGISSVLCVIIVVLFLCLPESPHHLIKKKLDKKAISSIQWYHCGCDVQLEFESLKKFIESSDEISFLDVLKEFRVPVVKKAFFISLTLLLYTQIGGFHNVIYYMETILRSAKVSIFKPADIVILIVSFSIVSSYTSTILIDNYGRKFLMIISTIFSVISFCLLALHFQLLYLNFDSEKLQFLSIVGIIGVDISVYIGLLPVACAIMSEIFPPNIKYTAACLCVTIAALAGFVSVETYQVLVQAITEPYLFLLYAVYLATAIPFTLIILPETKQKTLQEIQIKLMNN